MRLVSTSGLVALLVVFASVPQAIATPSTTIVIGEFRTRGPNGVNDEFIEIYNLSSSPIPLGGWTVRASDNRGITTLLATLPAGKTVGPGCHWLPANSNPSGGPYSGTVGGSQAYTTGVADNGGIALLNGSTIVDQVGMSTGSVYKEGTPLIPLTTDTDQGYERNPGGALGSGQDTDDNASDFAFRAPSDPQNLASPCITIPTATESESWGAVKGLFR